VIRILQGSAVTQTTLGGLTIYPPVANFLQCTCAKNYENWLAVDKVITKIIRLTFLAHPVESNVRVYAALNTRCYDVLQKLLLTLGNALLAQVGVPITRLPVQC